MGSWGTKTSANTYSSSAGPSAAGSGAAGSSAAGLIKLAALLLVVLMLVSCGRYSLAPGRGGGVKTASWYGPGFHGKRTASGEVYNMYAMTCAHKTLSFGTILKLRNVKNGRSATVVVNDRGPFVRGRDIDLSKAAASKLGIIGEGTGRVHMDITGRDTRYAQYIKSGAVSHSTGEAARRKTVYTVQVAAFGEKDSAVHMFKGLKLNHRKVYMMKKKINGTMFYRVRVGKFRSESKARLYAQRLADEGYHARVTSFEN